jgi:UDP-N-acetyl-D-mannosaminuronic acid dehydrogenase
VDDLRESPAIDVIHLLQKEGARVNAWEPFKPKAHLEGINMAVSLDAAIRDTDAILLLVRHTSFVHLAPGGLISLTNARIVIDTVNAWNADDWQSAGFQFHRLGDGKRINTIRNQ